MKDRNMIVLIAYLDQMKTVSMKDKDTRENRQVQREKVLFLILSTPSLVRLIPHTSASCDHCD